MKKIISSVLVFALMGIPAVSRVFANTTIKRFTNTPISLTENEKYQEKGISIENIGAYPDLPKYQQITSDPTKLETGNASDMDFVDALMEYRQFGKIAPKAAVQRTVNSSDIDFVDALMEYRQLGKIAPKATVQRTVNPSDIDFVDALMEYQEHGKINPNPPAKRTDEFSDYSTSPIYETSFQESTITKPEDKNITNKNIPTAKGTTTDNLDKNNKNKKETSKLNKILIKLWGATSLMVAGYLTYLASGIIA